MTSPQTPLCACGQPSPDARLCRSCTARLRSSLEFAASISADLDDAVARLTVRGSGGGSRRVPESGPPLDMAAMESRDALANELSGWVRVLLEHEPERCGPACRACRHGSCEAIRLSRWPRDTIADMARWLLFMLPAIRQREWAADMLHGVTSATAGAAAVIDRKPERVPAGMCETCGAQLLAELGADEVRCQCGMLAVALAARRRDRAAAADVLGSAGEISGALARIGIALPRGTITSWASRGRLIPRPGGVYALSEVLALHAQRSQVRG